MSIVEKGDPKNPPETNEMLSALVDGESDEMSLRRLLKSQSGDESKNVDQAWHNYQLIGSALRREPTAGVDISAAVSAAIASEPKIATEPEKKTGFNATKPIKQVAVAASVAAVAFLGIQQLQVADVGGPAGNAQVADAPQEEVFSPAADLLQLPPPGFDLGARGESSPASIGGAKPSAQEQRENYGRVPIDAEAFREHIEQSLQQHSENAADTSQDIYPMLRAPIENHQE